MFKKLKEKITEEVKSSPQRLQQLLQQQQQQQQDTSVTDENFFSLSEDDTNASTSTMEPGFTSVSLTSHERSRRNSNSSMASDVSFLPRYESTSSVYHLQSDFEASVSELEDNASTSSQLGHLTKEQIYSAFQKSQKQHHKYRGRYVDLARHYKELERENAKMKSVLVETQDKAIRRVSELKEQCNLEQKAKAHLENALRVELDEKQYKIDTLQTKIALLQNGNNENHSTSLPSSSSSPPPPLSENGETMNLLRKDLNDARSEIENLNRKLQEMKANTIIFQSKENDYKNKIVNLEKEIVQYNEREKENNIKLAENKMELHNELLMKDKEILQLKSDLEILKQQEKNGGKIENLQVQNKKLIDKLENLTQKCNSYEMDLLKLEQYKIEIKTLTEDLNKKDVELQQLLQEKETLQKDFDVKLSEQRDSAKKALLSLEDRIKEQVTAEYAEKEEKLRNEFLQKIENLTNNEELQTKLFEQEDLNQHLQQENRSLNEILTNLKTKYTELEENHLELIKEAAEHRNRIVELNKELEETRNTNNGFEDEVSRLTANLKKFQEVLTKVKNEKQQFENDYEDLMKKFDLEQDKQREIVELNEKLQSELENLTKNLEDLRNDYSNIMKENNSLKESLESLKTENIVLKNKIVDFEKLNSEMEKLNNTIVNLKSEIVELQKRNTEITKDNETLLKENSDLLNDLSELKIKVDLAQIEVSNYKEIADKIASEKQLLLQENEDLKNDFEKEKEENLKIIEKHDIVGLKETINRLEIENKELKVQLEGFDNVSKIKTDLDLQLKQLESQYNEILHEKQLLQDEVEELKTAPLNLKTESKQYETEINELHDKIIQYQSLDLTNKSSIEFYQNEIEKLKIKNEKLNRKLDETLVTLNHCAELSHSTEVEYLKNVLFNYMLGKESMVLARVIAAVCKFDEQQTEMILQKEQQRQSLFWGMLLRSMRGYAPYITLPFAAIVGFIGYNIEGRLSNKYTPYNDSIKELRKERLLEDQILQKTDDVGNLKYNTNIGVLDRNLSPSLQNH